jgi:hypothetical protein
MTTVSTNNIMEQLNNIELLHFNIYLKEQQKIINKFKKLNLSKKIDNNKKNTFYIQIGLGIAFLLCLINLIIHILL